MKTDRQWEKVQKRPHHGIALPLFSLYSKKSSGIGEFFDLILMIDWCKSLGMDVIQLLPINDTALDPSPYNPISSCALDPIYLSLADLPDSPTQPRDLSLFQSFTAQSRVPKAILKREKMRWLYSYYEKIFPATEKTDEYQKFIQENHWLTEYCLFKALKDEYGGKNWMEWPLMFQSPDPGLIEPRQKSYNFHAFLQYLCFSQMEKVKAYATKQNFLLFGDIPILLSPDSVGVWAHPEQFDLTLSAGAPPDFYNIHGQKWGFPLFNWKEMRKTGYSWWKQRLSVAEKIYHLYRIDHVVGFFRIWAIPPDKKPSEGFFIEQDPALWTPQGREILEMMIDASSLLPIAEDLGTIPKEVRPLLHELGISSTNVLRWERHWESDKSFIPYEEYNSYSLSTLSTADADITKMWWKKYPDEAIAFSHFKKWPYFPDLSDDRLFEILKDSHHTPSYFHVNLLQEYLSLFKDLCWQNLEDERVNVPGTVLPTNWTSRYRPSIEELVGHKGLADTMREILK